MTIYCIYQDCHSRAWAAVGAFLKENMTIFGGKTVDAESTTMPQVRQWARGAATELGGAPDDHCVILMINCPGAGILGANAKSFLISFITNCLADFPDNSLALLVHPNRANGQECRTGVPNFDPLNNMISYMQVNLLRSHMFQPLSFHLPVIGSQPGPRQRTGRWKTEPKRR